MLRKALGASKRGMSWKEFMPFTAAELRSHLENKFTAGMDWAAFMRGEIHIDHVIPQSRFHFESPNDEGFKRCWALSNLQPLWAIDNVRKGARLAA